MSPSRRLINWAFILGVLGCTVGWFPVFAHLLWGIGGLFVLIVLLDALMVWPEPELRIERHVAQVIAVGKWTEVELVIHHPAGRKLELQVFDHYPTGWELQGMPTLCSVNPGGFVSLHYQCKPLVRGRGQFGLTQLLIGSPLGLWRRHQSLGSSTAVRIFPDFSVLLGHTLTATAQQMPSIGLLRKRRRGEGTDFRQLREYREGDSLRAIDWKATARQFKPVTREYQEERDQQVVFLLDCGRRMLARDGDTDHFDHALNAMLSLAWIAQKQGDAVGVMSFGSETRWLAPKKGRTGLDRLIAGVFDLHAGEVAPDYLLAATDLMKRLRKRAFVVLLTNLRDEDGQSLRDAHQLLSRTHLVLCASLREAALDQTLLDPVSDFSSALRLSATEVYLHQRREAIKQLGMHAHQLIDVTPQRLTTALVDRYLEIKESALL